jgi:prolyl-tRNA editing enzyme YbaK/EbsC (Cys-tRNA(Pro) deacylase)
MWPAEVERIAAPLRAAHIEARLEELPPGEDAFPGVGARAVAYECDGRTVVALVPADGDVDSAKVAAVAGCRPYGRVAPPPFPFTAAARVFLEQRLLGSETVWLEAGSPRHVLGLEPSVLAYVTHAIPADLTQEGRI